LNTTLALKLDGTPLARVLLRKLTDCPRTRGYQEVLDKSVDLSLPSWDIGRGLIRTEPPLTGREATAPLCVAAFCWHSPLSRHHKNPLLLKFFESGLRTFTETINEDGLMQAFGLNGEGWAHGWDVEGLIYGIHFCREALDPELLHDVNERFSRSARHHAGISPANQGIGSIGNQRCVWILGLHLYGQILDDPSMIAKADRYWEDAMPKVLDASGQVIEQIGPCMHYSYTGFFYAWLNLVIRGDDSERERVVRCLEWFRLRHTNSLYPMAGPTTRQYYETMPYIVKDLLPASEQISSQEPRPLSFTERAMAKAIELQSGDKASLFTNPGTIIFSVLGHGASPWIWAILMAEDKEIPQLPKDKPVVQDYKNTTVLNRNPISYALARDAYQTHFNYTDFLPFSGIQTWAFGEEPPIIHPTPLAPSTTQGDRLDTARQGVSHNWGLYGAGAIGVDAYSPQPKTKQDIRFIVARYDWMWRLVFFTSRSTVILEFGNGGPRRTLWTLNRIEPAPVKIQGKTVAFEGRQGCLHTTVEAVPEIVTINENDPWATGVRQLRYDCGTAPAAFAFSDNSFRFIQAVPDNESPWRFADADGTYEVVLDERFFKPNPGNFRVDTFQLADGTKARMLHPGT
jgi:hypothetical protein